ncbi:MAG: hypothetical protein BAJATHORv1_10157 [Candidatus Thorarchaeota archaeon]|nr:MAG: hypothetical protein BAJATHORv1_10157 [Candidatus Thorarchaeota archaeon]
MIRRINPNKVFPHIINEKLVLFPKSYPIIPLNQSVIYKGSPSENG